jgi:hypothetical protein
MRPVPVTGPKSAGWTIVMFRVHFTPTLIALTPRKLLKRARCTYVTTEPDKWSFPKRFPIIL